jgi:hypothetical protein
VRERQRLHRRAAAHNNSGELHRSGARRHSWRRGLLQGDAVDVRDRSRPLGRAHRQQRRRALHGVADVHGDANSAEHAFAVWSTRTKTSDTNGLVTSIGTSEVASRRLGGRGRADRRRRRTRVSRPRSWSSAARFS